MSDSIGHYDILGLVGTGRLGTVYRARDTRVGRTVAIRSLGEPLQDPLQRTRFVDSIRPFTHLSHPHVATLFEVGEHDGRVYLVYEFVPGEKLAVLSSGRPLNVRRALDLAAQVADALAEAHAADLVHGAITPTSIIVTPKGHAKVLDFGLTAWTVDTGAHETAARLAARDTSLGTASVAFMSPEQVLGKAVDYRTDLFALGSVLYLMLTGRSPFEASTTGDTAVKLLQSTPPPPSRENPDVPPQLDAFVEHALAKNMDDRYQSAASMAADLRAIAALSHARAPESEPHRAATGASSSPRRLMLLLGLLIAVIALSFWYWREPLRQAWQERFGPERAPVLVIMPFRTAGSDLARAYYGPGFAEDLGRRLGHIPGVTVLGRSTIRSRAGRAPNAAAQSVRASVALTGQVTPVDEDWTSIDVRLELVGPEDGRAIWSANYRGASRDVIAMQARMARDLAARLNVASRPSAENNRALLRLVEPVAYETYLQAREALSGNDASRAAQLFESAAGADPSLIEAQAGLAEALYESAAFESRSGFTEIEGRMRDAAEEAVTADPDLALAQLAMGLAAPGVREALDHLRRAVEIDPTEPATYLAIADVVRDLDPVRSIRFTHRALQLDPDLPLGHYQLAVAHIALGQFEEALLETARGQALAPDRPWWNALRLRVNLARPSTRETLPASDVREAVGFPPSALLRAAALHGTSRSGEAAALLASLTRMYPGLCEARALMAGLRAQDGGRSEANRVGAQVVAGVASAANPAPLFRCAAMAAAAAGDGQDTARWIARAASSETGLRYWGAINGVLSPQAGLHQRIYPWSVVARDAEVIAAVARLDAAIARTRGDLSKALDSLLAPAATK